MKGKTYRIVQAGLGVFGTSWVRDIWPGAQGFDLVGVVDSDPAKLAAAPPGLARFTDLESALDLRPDAVMVVTDPAHHLEAVLPCLDRGIAVLVEKPVVLSRSEALILERRVAETGALCVVAENYSFQPFARTLAATLRRGIIGKIKSIDIRFVRSHRMTNYHAVMPHPLLLDVAIHHFDVLRFVTGLEVEELVARTWVSAGSWYREPASAEILMQLADGTPVHYRGSLDALESETGWSGQWSIEGTAGWIQSGDEGTRIRKPGGEWIPMDQSGERDGRFALVEEFRAALAGTAEASTVLAENLKTFDIAWAAAVSSSTRKWVSFEQGRMKQ